MKSVINVTPLDNYKLLLEFDNGERRIGDISTENTKLGSCTYQHQLRIGYQSREVGHGPDTQEDEWWIPPGCNPLIQDVQYRTFFVDADLQACFHVERYVTDKHTETDWNQQHGLKFVSAANQHRLLCVRYHQTHL